MLSVIFTAQSQTINRSVPKPGSEIIKSKAEPAYRWQDSFLNRFSYDMPVSPLLLPQIDSIKTNFKYNPDSDRVSITEVTKSDINVKTPTSLSFNEYSSLQNAMVRNQIIRDYERLQDGSSSSSGRGIRPDINKAPLIDKLFGGKVPEFSPIGFLGVELRIGSQFNNNPSIPLVNRRRPIFDFEPQININFNNKANQGGNSDFMGGSPTNTSKALDRATVNDFRKIARGAGVLGGADPMRERMNILGNFDTKSAFNFENQFKLNFKSDPEDILQTVEAGNVSFPLSSQLIPGVENLLGVKAGLRFGNLDVTTVVAQQKSRTESVIIQGGAQNRPFEIRCDTYDENKHFFLNQFFRNQYEASLKNLPMVTSGILITRVEVYVTNRTNTVTTMRNIVGLADLAEKNPYNPNVVLQGSTAGVKNETNSLIDVLKDQGNTYRQIDNLNTAFGSLGLKKGQDYELLRGAKRLTDTEFSFNAQLGYISLTTPLRNDEILAVSYEYTYNGEVYRVGELTEDYSFRSEDQAIILKLLKSSTIRNQLNNPMWDLMMKNVYSLSQGRIEREGFQLRVIYKDDLTGMDTPNLQEGQNLKDIPLISVLGLDRLNYNNDFQRDGNFDYVPGVTINEERGLVIFPVLEPFGSTLESKFTAGEENLKTKYVFQELYDRTLTDAQQINTKNKYFLNGSVQSSSQDIPLPIGATGASVRVYSGGMELMQGADYIVDNQLGRIRITNPSILASARPIRIDYERPDLFNAQIRRLFGLRLDYAVSRNLRVGGTLMDLRENTPGFLTRTTIGNEPVNNTLWGLDLNYKKEGNGLTRLLDKLPLIQTKEPSSILLSAEFAQLIPGVNTSKTNGNSMVDDFEASRNIYDLTRQPTRWRLGSTPAPLVNDTINAIYGYNYNRAKISVYSIDQSGNTLGGFGGGNGIVPEFLTRESSRNLYERSYVIQDIFPGRSRATALGNYPTNILDVSYFPEERGMYNYNPNLTRQGKLTDPSKSFGSIMRGITFDADFDNANVEYLEFWMLDPFQDQVRDGSSPEGVKNTTGGKLVFHLGDISEDVIPDNRFNFENGIPVATESASPPAITKWGKAPNTQYITDAFDTDTTIRSKQDVGLDGLSDEEERSFSHIQEFLSDIQNKVTPDVFEQINADPSGDNFNYFLDPKYNTNQYMVERYKDYLGMENNAPSNDPNNALSFASNIQSDKEDINQDNTINDNEAYYEYEIPLGDDSLEVGKGFIIDRVASGNANWYLFRIPIRTDQKKSVGGITGFKSIRFMRMVLKEWEQPVVLRFATLQLVSSQYRIYKEDLANNTYAEVPEPYDAQVELTTVSIEENGCSENGDCAVKAGETPYVVPPGFIRDRDFTVQQFQQFNEQSIAITVQELRDGDKRGVFKNTDLDLNMYKRLRMFVHMENSDSKDGIAGAFMRIGTDLKTNYYEIEIPRLKVTANGTQDTKLIWPKENEFDIPLDVLRDLKIERNRNLTNGASLTAEYGKDTTILGDISGEEATIDRRYRIRIMGNPDLSSIQTIMLGVTNPEDDDTEVAQFRVWMDELRVYEYNQTKGEAGVLAADLKLADIGTVSISANMTTFGFGGVQNKIAARSQENVRGFGVASTFALDKFFPQDWGLSIPLFINYDKQEIVPNFDPLNPDLELNKSLTRFNSAAERSIYRDKVIGTNINQGFNLANIRKIKMDPSKPNHVYDIENFSFSYAQNSTFRKNILLQEYSVEQKRGGFTYQYSPKKVLWEPFVKSESELVNKLKWIKDLNFSLLPDFVAFRTDFDRNFTKTQYRNAELTTDGIEANYIKYFLTNRFYDMRWDLTKSISLTYEAHMLSIIDEPTLGEINKQEVWNSLKSFGRGKNYTQSVQGTYKLPLDKFFLLDWVKADARFLADYQYRANAYDFSRGTSMVDANATEFGNFIENNREVALQGRIDLVQLYNKIKYLKFANSPNIAAERFTRTPGDDEALPSQSSSALKTITRILMTVRGINFNYSLAQSTILPGFLETPNLFGLASGTSAPGLGFVLGSQDYGILQKATEGQWISKSLLRNDPFTQNRQKRFDFSTNLEPFTGFRMQIKGNYNRGDSYQEIYRPNANGGEFVHINPFRNGTFSMSYWSFKTAFTRMDKNANTNYQYDIFDNMRANRQLVVDKLNSLQGEAGTYDLNSQDVLIPAFFAAYSGNTVDELFAKANKRGNQTFNPFLSFPLPNWRIDYNGLEKLPIFKKLFSSLTLSHSYSSTYSVGNFTSSLLYNDYALVGLNQNGYLLGNLPGASYTDNNGNVQNLFSPVFIMSSITMEERFSPMLGIQFNTKGSFSGSVEYNQERKASLSLTNSQVSEYSSRSLTMGGSISKNNVKLPFRGKDGNNIVLTNNFKFSLDFTIKDVTLLQRRLDGDPVPIMGDYNFQLKPTVNYQLNQKLNMGFYIEQFISKPFTTLTFESRRTVGGVSMRLNLAD